MGRKNNSSSSSIKKKAAASKAGVQKSPGSKRGGGDTVKTAKRIASSKMYTATGDPIRNLDSYMTAGGKPRNSAGDIIQNPRAYFNTIEASVRQNTDNPKYLYHYTTSEAASEIQKGGGVIKASSGGLDGAGTYMTAKPPRCRDDTLLDNNYGAGAAASKSTSYVDNYIRLDADHDSGLNAKRVTSSARDVWKVDGDVNLNHHHGYVAGRHHGGNNSYNHAASSFQSPYAAPSYPNPMQSPYAGYAGMYSPGGQGSGYGYSSANSYHESNVAHYHDSDDDAGDSNQHHNSGNAAYCGFAIPGNGYEDHGNGYQYDDDSDY